MLGKLLKYELKATSRVLLPLYAVLIVFAAINKVISLVSASSWQTPEVISFLIYMIILVGTFVMTYVVIIQRFYKNLLSDEGYLMFTLPTKPWQHIASKLLTSMMWMVASGLAALASIAIVAFDKVSDYGFWNAIFDGLSSLFEFWGASAPLFTIEIIIVGIVSLASSVLIIYASIAIGHLFNSHRVLASLGAFVALNTVTQILFAIAYGIPGAIFYPRYIDTLEGLQAAIPTLHFAIWYGVAFFGVLSAGYFFVSNYILSKRLNLE